MSAGIADRLTSLREEFEKGQKLLVELDARRERLKESMLRIAGAVQVLEEMESDSEEPPAAEEITVEA